MKKDKTFKCQDCKKEFREKAFTKQVVRLRLCPQCYTKRITHKNKKASKCLFHKPIGNDDWIFNDTGVIRLPRKEIFVSFMKIEGRLFVLSNKAIYEIKKKRKELKCLKNQT